MNKAHEKSLGSIMLLMAVLCLAVPTIIVMSADGGGGRKSIRRDSDS